jgi:hypothetical protein
MPRRAKMVAFRQANGWSIQGDDGRRDQPDRATIRTPVAAISSFCSRACGRSADAEEVRDDNDERDDEKDVNQPTGCWYGDKSEKPQHQNHAGDQKQHIRDLLSGIARADHDTSPPTIILRDGSVMPAQTRPVAFEQVLIESGRHGLSSVIRRHR